MSDAPSGQPPEWWPPPPSYQQPPPGYMQSFQVPRADTSGNAFGVVALVCGVVGLVLFWVPGLDVLLGVLATVFGVVGLNSAKKGRATNRGLSLSGLIMGLVVLVGTAVFLAYVFAIATPDPAGVYIGG